MLAAGKSRRRSGSSRAWRSASRTPAANVPLLGARRCKHVPEARHRLPWQVLPRRGTPCVAPGDMQSSTAPARERARGPCLSALGICPITDSPKRAPWRSSMMLRRCPTRPSGTSARQSPWSAPVQRLGCLPVVACGVGGALREPLPVAPHVQAPEWSVAHTGCPRMSDNIWVIL